MITHSHASLHRRGNLLSLLYFVRGYGEKVKPSGYACDSTAKVPFKSSDKTIHGLPLN